MRMPPDARITAGREASMGESPALDHLMNASNLPGPRIPRVRDHHFVVGIVLWVLWRKVVQSSAAALRPRLNTPLVHARVHTA
jgi:hypothetical protein